MKSWRPVFAQGLLGGSLATIFSIPVLLLAGRRQAGSAAAPVNAISHWRWGDEALRQRQPDMRHTLLGGMTHYGASTFWALLHAGLCRSVAPLRTPAGSLAGATATTGLACLVDYRLVPKRLTPGFEHHLSRPAMTGVYAAMALGLAAAALLMNESPARRPVQPQGPELARPVLRKRAGSV